MPFQVSLSICSIFIFCLQEFLIISGLLMGAFLVHYTHLQNLKPGSSSSACYWTNLDQSNFQTNSLVLTMAYKYLCSLAPGHLSDCLLSFSCSLTLFCHTGPPAISQTWQAYSHLQYTPYSFPRCSYRPVL